jgi:hypothetical protein
MVVAVPPEPIAAFRNQHLLAGPGQRRLGEAGRRTLECSPRFNELSPRAMVVLMTNPDVEVPSDPGAREDRRERLGRTSARLAHRHRPQFGMRREPSI